MRGCLISQARCISTTQTTKSEMLFLHYSSLDWITDHLAPGYSGNRSQLRTGENPNFTEKVTKISGLFLCSQYKGQQVTVQPLPEGKASALTKADLRVIINSYQYDKTNETLARQRSRSNAHSEWWSYGFGRASARTMHRLHQLSQRVPVPKNDDFSDQRHLPSSRSPFFAEICRVSSQRRAFFPLHYQHRLKVSTLLNIMVIAEAGAKSFLESSLRWRFLPLGERIEFSHLKTSHTFVNTYINTGNCKILLEWLYFNSFFTRYK